ncbi:MAG: CatB-related O-acetyltransferase [Vibrio litoralis]|uniref:CatB-related O-acetyltransferase n=1 Tax=Vibrio litoralis TaxID=335972 RepID=UPI003F96094B
MKRIITYYQIVSYMLKRINVRISLRSIVDRNSRLEGSNRIYQNAAVIRSNIGFGTYIGPGTTFISANVGRFCSIGPNCKIIVGTHPSKEWVSTHPSFFSSKKQGGFTYTNKNLFEEHKRVKASGQEYNCIIGSDVWLGSDVKILSGITIGDGAIIGSNSLVTKDIEPYSIAVGSPAKVIRYRFCRNDINFLMDFKWWNKNEDWIIKNAKNFHHIDIFKEVVEK